MARFAIDARVITAERDGVGRYARELVPALAAAAPSDAFLVLRHPSNREPVGERPAGNVREVFVEGRIGALVDHYLVDRRRLRAVFDAEGWPDVYHSLFHVVARRFPGDRRPSPAVVTTLHDLIWLDYPFAHGPPLAGLGTWLTARIAIAASLRRADEVIAVSAATAARAARWVPGARLTVVHHGVNRSFREPPPPLPAPVAHLGEGGRPWVAAVGHAKKYKNFHRLLEAFARATRRGLDARLALLGPCAPLAPLARSLGVGDRVVLAGEVGDETLRAVVGRAALFVHPAIIEGFGMPVVEAMALGTPTAVADVPVLREVGGDGALRFDPNDSEALAAIIEQVLTSEEAAWRWSVRARERSGAFDWGRCAEQTLSVYRRAMDRTASRYTGVHLR